MISARMATTPGGGGQNEDWVGTTPSSAVVLDGLTSPSDLDTGCVHGVPWYVNRLGGALLNRLADQDTRIAEALGQAITDVAVLHSTQCDLTSDGTPSATVAIVRRLDDVVEWLVLADTTIVIESDDGITVVTDNRVDSAATQEKAAVLATPPGPEHELKVSELVQAQRKVRNRPGGYWIAAADAAAATKAVTGKMRADKVTRCALLSDGVARLVEFGLMNWAGMLDRITTGGPDSLIEAVREAEAADPRGERWARFKTSDDATAVLVQF